MQCLNAFAEHSHEPSSCVRNHREIKFKKKMENIMIKFERMAKVSVAENLKARRAI